MMTNSEAIKKDKGYLFEEFMGLIKDEFDERDEAYNLGVGECIDILTKCNFNNLSSVFQENTKLKAEIEQLKAELEQSVRLPFTNADKIRSMSDEELAEFLSENTNCDCCNIQCIDKLNCPSMSSCLFRFIEWLQREVSE